MLVSLPSYFVLESFCSRDGKSRGWLLDGGVGGGRGGRGGHGGHCSVGNLSKAGNQEQLQKQLQYRQGRWHVRGEEDVHSFIFRGGRKYKI